jgi:small redox-active disulfide protein 2
MARKVQILGAGCAKCARLAANAAEAAKTSGVACEIEKVTDMGEIARLGVMLTPALAVDGEVKASGRVPTAEEIRGMIEEGFAAEG